jgi:hypothetical protein
MIHGRKSRMLAGVTLLPGAVAALAACAPLALTTYGVGASTAVSHSLGGITEPAPGTGSAGITTAAGGTVAPTGD